MSIYSDRLAEIDRHSEPLRSEMLVDFHLWLETWQAKQVPPRLADGARVSTYAMGWGSWQTGTITGMLGDDLYSITLDCGLTVQRVRAALTVVDAPVQTEMEF